MEQVPEPRIRIEPMSVQTVEAVAKLEEKCFSTPWSLDALAEEISNPIAVYFTAWYDQKIVGYIGMHHIMDEGYINNIAIDPDYRRKKIATALIEHIQHYAKENSLKMLTLEVRQSNIAAIKMYENFGFENVGVRKNYYSLPTEDAVLMTLEL